MHADWQLIGSEPSEIRYVQQHEHGHDFTAVPIPLYCPWYRAMKGFQLQIPEA